MPIKFTILLFAVLVFAFVGCDNSTDPGNGNGNGSGNNNSAPFPTNFGGVTPTHIMGVVRVGVAAGGTTFSTGTAFANLNNQDKGTVTVTVSGNNYELSKSTGQQVAYYYQPSQTNPTGINLGTNAVDAAFSVSGYSLDNASVTVPAAISLTSPSAGSNISRSQDLSISWSGGSAQSNAIFITDKNGKNIFKEVSSGAASADFTAAELGTLSSGTALVYAISYNYQLANNNEAVIIGEAVASSGINLQ